MGWNIILTASLMSIIKNTSTKDETDNSGTAIISHTVHGYTTELTDAVEKVQSKIVTVNIFSEETNKSLTGVIYASNSNGTYIVTSASLLSEEETKIWQYSTTMLYNLYKQEENSGKIDFPDT